MKAVRVVLREPVSAWFKKENIFSPIMKRKITYEFKNNLSELDDLRLKLDLFGNSQDVPEEIMFKLHLAVEEHFANIISYGYTDKGEHRIKVTLSYDNNTVEIRIEDDGIPFNPEDMETPDVSCDIEAREVGGLGIHLTKTCMDDFRYQRKENRNILILQKNIG